MQKLTISIAKQNAWLRPFVEEQLAPFISSFDISFSENPIASLTQDKINVVVMPLQECAFEHPAGILITALSKRQNTAHLLAVGKNNQDAEKLLGIPTFGKLAVASFLLEKLMATFFTTQTIIIEKNIVAALENPDFDAVLMPEWYSQYIDTSDFELHSLHPSEFTPEAGQGTVAWLCYADDLTTRRLLKNLHDSETTKLNNTERKLQKTWQAQGKEGFAYCEKDSFDYYHLYTLKIDENKELLKAKNSSSTLATWATLA